MEVLLARFRTTMLVVVSKTIGIVFFVKEADTNANLTSEDG
jgi:hypothetical protein